MDIKAITLRLPKDLADSIEMLARARNVSTSEEIREALVEHVERRRKDPQVQTWLDAALMQTYASYSNLSTPGRSVSLGSATITSGKDPA